MSELHVYFWLMLDNLNVFLGVAGFFIVMVVFTTIICKGTLSCIPMLCWALPFFVCFTLLPTTKQYAVIKILPRIAQSELVEDIKSDLPEMYDLAKQHISEKMKRIRK